MGFDVGQVWIASQDHALQIQLIGSRQERPIAKEQTGQAGQAQPMQKVEYKNAWPDVTVEYETAAGAIAKSTYYISPVNQAIRLIKSG